LNLVDVIWMSENDFGAIYLSRYVHILPLQRY
jgi:hypothetical protein